MTASRTGFDDVARLLESGAHDGTFPAGQAVVIHKRRELLSARAGACTLDTRFDLASLTKIMATTAVFMRLWALGRLGPDAPISRWLPDSGAAQAGVTVADLLFHRSGLPAFIPFFAAILRSVPEIVRADCPPSTRASVREEVIRHALSVEPMRPPGAATAYSDVGFIVLGELLSRAAGQPLDVLYDEHVATPLGLAARFQRISNHSDADEHDVAPTGMTRPRDPAPGQEGLWKPFEPAPSRVGEVDDDNAFVMDGVAPHAGLFGTARDVARFGQSVLDELGRANRIAPASLWERALTTDPMTRQSTRAMGFDTPTTELDPLVPSSAGRFIGQTPPGAFGHLAFTGCSLWVDRRRELVVALCTNRTYNGRGNLRIRDFRPRFHDAVIEALETHQGSHG